MWSFLAVKAIAETTAGVPLEMLKMGDHAILPGFVCPNLTMTFRTAFDATGSQPQGFSERNAHPLAADLQLAGFSSGELVHFSRNSRAAS
jgi:hypothetical protein